MQNMALAKHGDGLDSSSLAVNVLGALESVLAMAQRALALSRGAAGLGASEVAAVIAAVTQGLSAAAVLADLPLECYPRGPHVTEGLSAVLEQLAAPLDASEGGAQVASGPGR